MEALVKINIIPSTFNVIQGESNLNQMRKYIQNILFKRPTFKLIN